MKLNNKGWGLGFLIVIGTLFLLILIFVSIRIRSITHQSKDDNKSSNNSSSENMTIDSSLYVSLEQVLKRAGETYTVYHTTLVENTSDHLIVSFDTLKSEGLIESLSDPYGNGDCEGYVFIKSDYSVNPFIKCSKYETLNYSLWVD